MKGVFVAVLCHVQLTLQTQSCQVTAMDAGQQMSFPCCSFSFISFLCFRAHRSCSLDTGITEMFPNQFSLGTASLSPTRCCSIYTVHFLPVATSRSYFFIDRLFEFLRVKECSELQKNHWSCHHTVLLAAHTTFCSFLSPSKTYLERVLGVL